MKTAMSSIRGWDDVISEVPRHAQCMRDKDLASGCSQMGVLGPFVAENPSVLIH